MKIFIAVDANDFNDSRSDILARVGDEKLVELSGEIVFLAGWEEFRLDSFADYPYFPTRSPRITGRVSARGRQISERAPRGLR